MERKEQINMEVTKNIMELLFRVGKTLDFLKNEPKTGKRTSAAHAKAPLIRKEYSETGAATLNCAAFLIKAVLKDELRLAITTDGDNAVYGEFNHFNKRDGSTSSWQFIYEYSETEGPSIEYVGEAPEDGSPYELLPYAVGRLLTLGDDDISKELTELFALAVLHAKDGNDSALRDTYAFCDSFYYHVKSIWNDGAVAIDEHYVPMETVKEARHMGRFFDLGTPNEELPPACGLNQYFLQFLRNPTSGISFTPCEAFEGVDVITAEKKTEKKADVKWEDVLNDIKIGKYFVAHTWTSEQEAHIPPLSYLDTFIPSEEFYELLRKIDYRIGNHMVTNTDLGKITPDDIKNDIVNVLLYGDPGSGKTAMVHALAAATRMPLYSIKFNEDSEDDVFEGKNKIVSGQISFVGTDFLEGFEKGGIIIMEEINLGRANMLTSVMNQAMEYPFYVEKNGYQKVTRHPLVVAFATMNLDTDGTTTLNSAMAQRFNNKFMIGEPTAAQFKERLCAQGFPKERVEFVYKVYAKIRDYLKENSQRQKYLKELSIRQCMAALQDMEEGTSFKRAIFNTMYGAICIKNRKLADQIKVAILDTCPDYKGV